MIRPRLLDTVKRVTFLGLLLSLSTAGATPSNLSPEVRNCLFRKPIAFGASLTQATTALLPGYRGLVRGVEIYGNQYGTPSTTTLPTSTRPYGLSPIRYVTKALAGKAALPNITYIGSYVTRKVEEAGSSQIEAMLRGEHRALYSLSRLIVGVDAFYWDAVWDLCPSGRPLIRMNELIASAKKNQKYLVLGNVPIENPELVRIASDRTTVQKLWYPPTPSCVNQINEALAARCTPENNCYLLDMKKWVDHLAAGGEVSVFGQGSYGHFDMRPDGVHLSDVGSRFVAERILQAFEEHPPKCEAQ